MCRERERERGKQAANKSDKEDTYKLVRRQKRSASSEQDKLKGARGAALTSLEARTTEERSADSKYNKQEVELTS